MARKRGSEYVVLTEADLEITAAALLSVMPAAAPEVPEEPQTMEEILEQFGATLKEQIRNAAKALEGSPNTKGNPYTYTAARRFIERYVTGAGQKRGRVRPNLKPIARSVRRPKLNVNQALAVSMTADVKYQRATRQMPSGYTKIIPSNRLGKVRRLLREGDELAAANALLDEFVYAYGLNDDGIAGPLNQDSTIGNILEIYVGKASDEDDEGEE